jgi:hypothetical protein
VDLYVVEGDAGSAAVVEQQLEAEDAPVPVDRALLVEHEEDRDGFV